MTEPLFVPNPVLTSPNVRAAHYMGFQSMAEGQGGGGCQHRIITTLCPGGKERMRRLMSAIAARRVDFGPMVTHRFKLDDIEAAYDLFGHQRDGVLKVAITP